MFKHTPLFLAVTLSAGIVTSVQAQEVQALRGENFSIEEVVVTARKKAESLQTVPIAIDAIGAIELQEKGIKNIADVAKHTPGLSFDVGIMPNDTRPTIRGLTNTRGRGNVAILVDGVDISSETLTTAGGGTGANLNLMDLERIEVVKGPQSATYGRSAFSGAVNYVTKRPGQETEAKVNVDVNEHGRRVLSLGGSAPLNDMAAASLNISTTKFDGHFSNPNTGGDLGTEDSEGAAFALNLTPSDDFSAYFRTEYSEAKYSQRPSIMRSSTNHTGSNVFGGDFGLMGSVGEYGKSVPVPGSGTTQADCDAAVSAWQHKIGGADNCVTVLTGAMGSAQESSIDLSPNPATGADFAGTEVRNIRTSLELSWDVSDDINVLSLTGYNTNDSRIQEDFDLTNYTVDSLANYFGPGTGAMQPYAHADYSTWPPTAPSWWTPYAGEYTQYGANNNSDTSFNSFQFSQELRVSGTSGKLDWMVDALYWKESMDTVMNQMWWLKDGVDKTFWDAYIADTVFGTFFPDGSPVGPRDVGIINHRTGPVDMPIPMSRNTDHKSLAFTLNYNLTDAVRVNVEGRYMEEKIDYSSLALDTLFNGLMGMPVIDFMTFQPIAPEVHTYARDDEAFTPRFGLDWQVSDNLFTYVSYSEGYKPGGMTTSDGNGDMTDGEYNPEKLKSYELGFKSNLLDNRLQLNGAIFKYEYTDQQVSTFKANSAGVLNTFVSNAGKSELNGLEFDAIYRPSQNWTFTAGYVMADTEYKEFNVAALGQGVTSYDKVYSGNAEGDFSGKQFRNSPKHSANLSIRYDGTFDSGVEYFTEVMGSYTSKRYLTLGNDAHLSSYWMTDFNAGIKMDNLQAVLYINNVADDDKIKAGISNVSYGHLPGAQSTPAGANLTLADPRTVGLRVTYNFF